MNEIFLDRDYLKDKNGDIYQVIGSVHPQESVFALQKYMKVVDNKSLEEHEELIPEDILRAVKDHPMRYWIDKKTGEKYIRILPNYSSASANKNIENHPYSYFSSIFGMNVIQVPKKAVINHYHPKQRYKQILNTIKKGSFEERQKLDKFERETVELLFILEDVFGIDLNEAGVTGSILWKAQHEQSDIDLMLYGKFNTQQILKKGVQITREGNSLRRYMKIEILPMAEKLSIKTGLPMEECFEFIFNKPYLFYFKNIKFSITFAPTLFELVKTPLYTLKSQFKSIKPITIQAIVKESDWGLYYPGIFEIQCTEIKTLLQNSNFESFNEDNITRLLVFEHELVGYYQEGDYIEIKGLLQKAIEVPDFKTLELHDTYQILVGGIETFGDEYVRIIK